AMEQTGTRRFVRARQGVVLSMGGYIFDPEMMAEQAPGYARCSLRLGTAGDDGTGIRMGEAAGGTLGQMNRCSAPRFVDPPTAWWRGILVGRSGQRICNETLYGGKVGDYLIEEHGGRGTLILDNDTMTAGRRQVFGEDVHAFQRIFGVINGWVAPTSAPTLEKLAQRLGINAAELEKTVAEYNAGVQTGHDKFGKSKEHCRPIRVGPFFGIPLDNDTMLFPTPCLTLGGLRTEGTSSRVIGHDGAPIDGLYAAGRTAVGVASNGYASGLSISDGLFAGRNAGRHAASRNKTKVVQSSAPQSSSTNRVLH
ncbi:MAG: FAD-binding protein, partial [Nannocystaceae bacterium]|nr:FAD-binding protein [Nannocystaceae bacterium]